MKKLFAGIWLMLALSVCAAAEGFVLPSGLTQISADAFRDDMQISGVLAVPSDVEQIGSHAFSGTGLYALDLPEGLAHMDTQALEDAAYVYVRGSETTVGGLSGVRYLFAPESAAAQAPDGVRLIAANQLAEYEGFFYLEQDGALTLLCAKDASAIGETVAIPAEALGLPVTAVAKDAFVGMTAVKTLTLPAAVRGSVTPEALKDCPSASVRYDDEAGLVVRAVTADVEAGPYGSSITWSVDASAQSSIRSYAYTLTKNGQTVAQENSAVNTFTYDAQTAGAYQLSVAVTDGEGAVARGASAVLYIAEQTLDMTVPSTLENGEDLVVEMSGVEGAMRYILMITDTETKENISYSTLTSAGKKRLRGYGLDAGTYCVAGYVIGADFQYSIPTVRYVTVTGEKAAGPQLPEYAPISLQDEGHVEMTLSESEPFAVRYWFRYRDGSTNEPWTYYAEPGEEIWIWPEGDWDMFGEGSCLFLQGAVQQDGRWTDWGDIREVEVLTEPTLDKPDVTIPETAQAGKDLMISFEAVENAERYYVRLYKGTEPWGESLYFESFRAAGEAFIPGYELSAGTYCVAVEVRAEGYADREDAYLLTVTGTRPAAPTITADKTEIYATDDSVTLTILAPGAEGAYIDRRAYYGNSDTRWGDTTISLDENGKGTYSQSYFGGDLVGYTYQAKVAAIINGVWSEFGVLELPIVARPPMDTPVVTMPSTLTAGQDFTFRVAPVENAQEYSASIRRSYGDSFYHWNSSELKANQDMTLPGYELTQGNYVLTVEASSEEFGSSEISMPLTVTGTKPAAPTITADLDQCHIKETITFDIDTAGADKVCIDYEGVTSWSSSYTTERTAVGDLTQWSYSFSESELGAAFTFRFSVRKDGVWSAWKTFERTVLDLPPLDAPVIHANAIYQAGEDMLISFDPVEHAQEYSHTLWNENGSGNGGSKQAQENTYLYNGYEYEPGVYRLEVTAKSSAYRNAVSEMTIEVVGTKPAAPAVSVDESRAARYEDFTFTLDTTGAQAARYKYKKNTSDYWNGSGSINVLEDSTKWTTYQSSSGTYEYVFCVLRDGRWTQWSEPVEIFIEDSSLPAPVLSIPASPSAGQDLTVSVAPIDGMTYCYVYLYNSYGTQIASRNLSGAAGGTVTFEGYLLTQGNYTVKASAGSSTSSSETSVSLRVLSGDRPAAPDVQAETETGCVNIRYGFTVATEGAQLAAVRFYQEGNTGSVNYRTFDVTESETIWQDAKYEADQTWRYAFAVKKDGVWSPWSASRSVYITSREMLPKVTLNASASVEAGKDLVVSFEGVENADSYMLYLYRPDGSGSGWTAYPGVERRFVGYDLSEGVYRIVVHARGAQYEDSVTEKTVTVTGSRPTAPTVSVDADEVYTEEKFTFLIDSAGAKEIAYKYTTAGGSSSSGRLNVLSALTRWETYGWDASVYSYSFSVLRDDTWSAWSAPVQITVKPRAPLTQPQFTAPQTIEQGRDLTVSVSAVADATYYYVNIYNRYGENISSRSLNAPGDAVFPGYLLPLGQLRIEVEARNNVGGYSETVSALSVVQAQNRPAAPAVSAQSTTVTAGEYAVFTLDTAGAQQAAARIYRVGTPNNVWYEKFNTDESGTTMYSDYLSYSDCTYAYSFAVQADGVWSAWSDFTEIEIQ